MHTSKLQREIFEWILIALLILPIPLRGQNLFNTEHILAEQLVNEPSELALNDLDQDGLPDLTLVSDSENSLQWYRNNGGLNFSDPIDLISTDYRIKKYHFFDWDDDGDLDLFISSLSNRTLGWFRNDDGVFVEQELFLENFGIYDFDIGDVDSDGVWDLVVLMIGLTGDIGAVTVWKKDSTGSFALDQISYAPSGFASQEKENRIELVDLNNSGVPDILIECKNIFYLENDGTGSYGNFINPGGYLLSDAELTDFDNDQDLDLVFASHGNAPSIGLIENTGDGFLEAVSLEAFDFAPPVGFLRQKIDVCAADLDGDGFEEIISSNTQDFKTVYLKNLAGGLYSESQELFARTSFLNLAGDLDLDGDIDLIKLGFGEEIVVYDNTGDGNFEQSSVLNELVHPNPVHLIDLDDDGDLDIISLGKHDNSNQINFDTYRENLGDGNFSALEYFDFPLGTDLDIVDLNGDGEKDILTFVLESGSQNIYVVSYEHTANLEFEIVDSILLAPGFPSYLFSYRYGDYDNDNDQDIFLFAYDGWENAHLILFENESSSAFAEIDTLLSDVNYTEPWKIIDLNGDSLPDLLGCLEDQGLNWFENQADGTFSSPNYITSINPCSFSAIDINGDGFEDVVGWGFPDAQFHINNGMGSFTNITVPISITEYYNSTFENFDADGDGDDEVLWTGYDEIGLLFNYDEPYGFCQDQFHYMDYKDHAYDDIDNDGDVDVLIALGGKFFWLENKPSIPEFSFTENPMSDCWSFEPTVSICDYSGLDVLWDFGDGETSDLYNIGIYEFTEPGDYNVSLTLCNNAGCSTFSQIVNITKSVDLEIPEVVIVNTPVQFIDNSQGWTSFSWVFGDGEVSTEMSPTHTYTETGTYTIEHYLTDENFLDCTRYKTYTLEVVSSLGIESGVAKICVWPNPSSDFIKLDAPFDLAKLNYSISNTQGEVLKEGFQACEKIDVSDLSAGLYLLRLFEEGEAISSTKFMVTR